MLHLTLAKIEFKLLLLTYKSFTQSAPHYLQETPSYICTTSDHAFQLYLSTSPIHHSLSHGHRLMSTMATHQLCKALRDCCVKCYTSSLAGLETNHRTTAPQQQCYNNNISSTDYNVLVFVWMHPNQTAWCTVLLLWCPLQGFKWFCSPLIHIYTRFFLPHVYPR